MRVFWLSALLVLLSQTLYSEPVRVMAVFDHDAHNKAFKDLECSHCHTFKVDPKTKKAILSEDSKASILNKPTSAICHECHRGQEKKYLEAPKTCFTCHRSTENLSEIKPLNHTNMAWKTSHALNAKVAGSDCNNCHLTSYCVKCHQRRNDIEMQNHPRNFRYTHSIMARATPQSCDSCHSRSYCIDCHSKK